MFREAVSFNQPLGNWILSSCLNMSGIFVDAKAFDQDVESWPNWEGKGWEGLDTDIASEDEEDNEEDISSGEEQDPSDQSDGD